MTSARVDHCLPDVGVQIEGDGDRHSRPRDRAHAANDLRLRVGEILCHHRAVQGQHDAVGGQGGGDALTEFADEGLERRAVGNAGRRTSPA